MKAFISMLLLIIQLAVIAQTTLVPHKNAFEKKWIKTETYQMKWFALKDTAKIGIGEVLTQTLTGKKYVTIITEVKMKNSKGPWIDTTVAKTSTLEPIRHTSYNAQRDMELNFGKVVTGFYHDKIKQEHYNVNDTTARLYFDSNIYPALITWLPLKEGYKQDISIYDYSPSEKKGVIKAYVKNVTSGAYQTTGSGIRDVWVVTVADEISNDKNNFMIYYIDKNDRRLWKQEIHAAGRKMVMLRNEP